MLNACVGTKPEMEKGDGAIDVCLAIEEMKQKAGWSVEQSKDVQDVFESDWKELQPLIRLSEDECCKSIKRESAELCTQ